MAFSRGLASAPTCRARVELCAPGHHRQAHGSEQADGSAFLLLFLKQLKLKENNLKYFLRQIL